MQPIRPTTASHGAKMASLLTGSKKPPMGVFATAVGSAAYATGVGCVGTEDCIVVGTKNVCLICGREMVVQAESSSTTVNERIGCTKLLFYSARPWRFSSSRYPNDAPSHRLD